MFVDCETEIYEVVNREFAFLCTTIKKLLLNSFVLISYPNNPLLTMLYILEIQWFKTRIHLCRSDLPP